MLSDDVHIGLLRLGSCISHINDIAKYKLNIPVDRAEHLRDAWSYGQLLSKIAALKHLRTLQNMHTIALGQWHGLLPYMLQKFGISDTVVGIEIDQFWHDFCIQLQLKNYSGYCTDATDPQNWQQHLQPDSNLILNTSCEHMSWQWLDFDRSSSCGYIYAQGNDYVIPEHTNVCSTLDEFVDAFKSRGYDIQYKTSISFPAYNRWCVLASWI